MAAGKNAESSGRIHSAEAGFRRKIEISQQAGRQHRDFPRELAGRRHCPFYGFADGI